jgi:hypothetical protein
MARDRLKETGRAQADSEALEAGRWLPATGNDLAQLVIEIERKTVSARVRERAELLVAPRVPEVPERGSKAVRQHGVDMLALRTAASERDATARLVRAGGVERRARATRTAHERLRDATGSGGVGNPWR